MEHTYSGKTAEITIGPDGSRKFRSHSVKTRSTNESKLYEIEDPETDKLLEPILIKTRKNAPKKFFQLQSGYSSETE